ncbi:hypothetical protein HK100_005615 [Physocladia obscura]|uniref:Poly(A)-specific ribonuclease RNA-binding domain-containing protein n=1 Tax=Physocladia obscura TaxID=109957 RepID=A0AAD5SRH1_9FUNG|nr:hypothetical protein HK100_005615 [Physocladia obscura]
MAQFVIGRKTFGEALRVLRAALATCDVVAIDTELTGLHRAASEAPHVDDTPQRRFDKMRASAAAFAVVQFGVSTFTVPILLLLSVYPSLRWDPAIAKYVARAFNFPIFAHQGKALFALDRRFLVESSSVDFLVNNGFNFDDTFKNGIPYVRHDEERRARINIDAATASSSSANDDAMDIDEASKAFVDSAMSRIDDWFNNATSLNEPLTILAENSYKKRLIHQQVRLRYDCHLSTRARNRDIVVSKASDADRAKAKASSNSIKDKLDAELDYLVGFRHVVDAISASGKPLIGHNISLSNNPEVPCRTARKRFRIQKSVPFCLSSKYITNSALQEMATQLSQYPFKEPDFIMHPDFPNYASTASGQERFHEASYDAYITGTSFLKMMHLIANLPAGKKLDLSLDNESHNVDGSDEPVGPPGEPTVTTKDHLKRFLNKLNVMRSDEPVLNLTGDESPVDKSHLVHLSNFPSSWKTHTLLGIAFPHLGHAFVRWLSDTSCFIAVTDRSRVAPESVAALRSAVAAKRLEEDQKASGGGAAMLAVTGQTQVLMYDEFLALFGENAGVAQQEQEQLPVVQGKKRTRVEGEVVEEGEVDESEDGVTLLDGKGDGVTTASFVAGKDAEIEEQAAKRQKVDNGCFLV